MKNATLRCSRRNNFYYSKFLEIQVYYLQLLYDLLHCAGSGPSFGLEVMLQSCSLACTQPYLSDCFQAITYTNLSEDKQPLLYPKPLILGNILMSSVFIVLLVDCRLLTAIVL